MQLEFADVRYMQLRYVCSRRDDSVFASACCTWRGSSNFVIEVMTYLSAFVALLLYVWAFLLQLMPSSHPCLSVHTSSVGDRTLAADPPSMSYPA